MYTQEYKPNVLIYNAVTEMKKSGMTNSEIMKRLNISYKKLRIILDSHPHWDIGE